MNGLPDDRLEGFTIGEGPVGVLTCHGFTGTPYEMREMAVYLAEQGYRVTNVRLAGHALDEEAMALTRWTDWWQDLRRAYLDLAAECEQVYMCGLSMGGVLGLHLAAHYPLAGAVIMCAPIFLDNPQVRLVPLIKHVVKIRPKGDSDIKDAEARAIHPNHGGTPYACLDSFLQFMRHVNEDLPEVRCPLHLIYSRGDTTVPYRNMAHIAAQVSSETVEQLTVDNSGHVITVDVDKQQVFEAAHGFFERVQHTQTVPVG